MRTALLLFFFGYIAVSSADEPLPKLNGHSLWHTTPLTTSSGDSIQFKTPKHRQGKFCDFEDQLHRKKIPLNFSLGDAKY